MDQIVEDEVIIEMKEMIQGCGDGGLLPECCIYKVLIVLRELNNRAYTPKLVSIGPFHHGDVRLEGMERHKQILFKRFMERTHSSLVDLVRCVKYLEPKVRASYLETIHLTERELVKLTLMDAAFIIEFIMQELVYNDVTASQPWLANSIILDLILLENQLPFFVLEELFNRALPHDYRGSLPSFLELTRMFFLRCGQKVESIPEVEVKHFTDLIRWSYLQGRMTEPHLSLEAENHILRYNANALHEAGIKFKSSKSTCLLDWKFSGHTLEIPQIDVDDRTEILFRNMIALEQCHYPYTSHITEYAAMMDRLIDTYEDVDILIHNNIVNNNIVDSNSVTFVSLVDRVSKNFVDSKSVALASVFNGLVENVLHTSFNPDNFDICKMLNGYCLNPWHKKRATLMRDYCKTLRRDYCNTPWRIVVSVAGIILLLLTIAQTIFSALQVL